MDEESNSYQLHSARMADYILCSHQPYVRYSAMYDCLPASEDREAFQNALKNDPQDRFCYIDEGEDMLIGLKNLSEEDTRIQADVEWWRASIAQYLERVCVPVELGRIASLVERPIDVPRSIRLKDIVNSDYAKRFCIHGPPDRLMLSRRISADEIEESRDTWRKRIHDFLYLQAKDVTLTTLGSSVARPTNIGGTKTKLIELLQSDPEERFHLVYRSPTETVVRVKLTDSQREWLHEKWRIKAATCLFEQQRTMTLTELGASVRRPSVHLGSTSSLRVVLMEDPQCRFILSGHGDNIRVRISADAEMSRHSRSLGASKGDPHGWSEVSRRAPVGKAAYHLTPAASTPHSKSAAKIKHRQTTEAELDLLSARQERWNSRAAALDSTSTSEEGVFPPQASPGDGRSDTTTPSADSPDMAFLAHTSSWDWKSPLDDALMRCSMFQDQADPQCALPPPSIGTGTGTGNKPPAAVYTTSRVSYKEKLLPSQGKSSEAGGYKVICRPSPGPGSPVQTTQPRSGPSLSPYAPAYTPFGVTTPAAAALQPVSSAATGDQVRLQDWLPGVLAGFPPELVADFSARLHAEGFLCVKDLIIARALGQLTAEYLAEMGFKIGHSNRIFACLPKA